MQKIPQYMWHLYRYLNICGIYTVKCPLEKSCPWQKPQKGHYKIKVTQPGKVTIQQMTAGIKIS